MNIERMDEVALALESENLPCRFNMTVLLVVKRGLLVVKLGTGWAFTLGGSWSEALQAIPEKIECGTVACIAGLSLLMYGTPREVVTFAYAGSLLDLNYAQYTRLFLNYNDYIKPGGHYALRSITPQQAAAAIRRMVVEEGNKQ